jgi:L-ascorbate metabolism protein UlaG (beta-lactamase superfamily)
MIITYFGKQFFKIQQGEMVLSFNPISKDSKSSNGTKFGSDVALITTNHPDYNGISQLSHGEREPFVISGPGDYEVREIFVKGIMSDSNLGGKKYINTIYTLSMDNIEIVFLGALSDSSLSKEAIEAIGNPDILFIPVGGKDILDAKNASKLSASLEPKIVIPMDYDAESLKAFLKEAGAEGVQKIDKLTLKRKDLDGKAGEVIVLDQS